MNLDHVFIFAKLFGNTRTKKKNERRKLNVDPIFSGYAWVAKKPDIIKKTYHLRM